MYKSGNFLLSSQFETSKYPHLYAQRSNYVSRLGLNKKLAVHNGCINTLSWSDTNCKYILSGSDDQFLSITDAFTGIKKISLRTGHRANIFSAKFLPKTDDERLISCSADGSIYLTDINYSETINNEHYFACHGNKTCYDVLTFVHDPFIFVSCGQDGCCKWIDLRQSSKCEKQFCQEHTLIKLSTGISAIAMNPFVPYHIVCAGLDGITRFYDRRMLSVGIYDSAETISTMTDQSTKGLFASFSVPNNTTNNPINTCNIPGNTVVSDKRITSLQYDNWGSELLVSYQTDNIYLLDWRDLSMENKNEIANISPSSESPDGNEASSPMEDSPSSRKFRIQTDWSDTGPESQPIDSSNNPDTRTYLMRRLNNWFSDLYQNRSASASVQTASALQQTSTLNTNESTEPNISLLETESNDNRLKNKINSSNENQSDNAEQSNNDSNKSEKPKTTLSPLTSYLMCSRIRTKQAMKLENNIIKKQPSPKVKMVYTGHRNARTIIKECNFWGDNHVISGSDCGHIFFWDKHTGKIVNVLEADKRVVNCIQENPLYPVLASSGIDYDIKIWEPILESSVDIDSTIAPIIEINKLMLNENRKTIFIPVQFMVPALRLFGANMRNNSSNSHDTNNIEQENEGE